MASVMENWINQLKTSWSTTPSQGHWPDLKTEMVFRKPEANKILTKQYRSQNHSDRRLRLKAVRQEVVCAAGERNGNWYENRINPLKPELNPICYLLALLAHHFLHVSRIRIKSLTFRRLMSYIYIYGAPILDVSRSHTTTQHSR